MLISAFLMRVCNDDARNVPVSCRDVLCVHDDAVCWAWRRLSFPEASAVSTSLSSNGKRCPLERWRLRTESIKVWLWSLLSSAALQSFHKFIVMNLRLSDKRCTFKSFLKTLKHSIFQLFPGRCHPDNKRPWRSEVTAPPPSLLLRPRFIRIRICPSASSLASLWIRALPLICWSDRAN